MTHQKHAVEGRLKSRLGGCLNGMPGSRLKRLLAHHPSFKLKTHGKRVESLLRGVGGVWLVVWGLEKVLRRLPALG